MKYIFITVLLVICLNAYSQNLLNDFLKNKPDSKDSPSIKKLYLGGEQYVLGDLEEAEINLKKSIEMGLDITSKIKAELALGLIYIESKEYEKALSVLQESESYEYGYYYAAVRLIAKYKRGDEIENELNKLLNSWVDGHYDDYYLSCDFLLKIDKPDIASIFIKT